jgi:hypothetical protein
MGYQTQAAIGPYPVNCLQQAFMLAGVAVPRLTGIAAIDDVSPGAIVDSCRSSIFCLLSLRLLLLRLSMAIAIAPAAFAPAVDSN